MAYIDKLLNKFNKAKNKVDSFKGIVSDFKSISYDSVTNTLGDGAEQAITDATAALTANRDNVKSSFSKDKRADLSGLPKVHKQQLIYPYHDKLSNYIVFNIRPRVKRASAPQNLNVFKDQSVALYIPDSLISQANVQYRAEGIGLFNRSVLDLLKNFDVSDPTKNLGQTAENLFGAGAAAVANKISGGLLNVSLGVAVNPQQEQLFDSVPFRTWDFTFDFYARSDKEAQHIRDIIYTFRSSMLPDVMGVKIDKAGDGLGYRPETEEVNGTEQIVAQSASKVDNAENFDLENSIRPFYNLPNIVDIEFAGPMGDQVDGFLPAVISNVQIDYTGGQKFSTHVDGMPMHIQMTLQFMEIRIMSLNNYETFVRAKNTTGETVPKDSDFTPAEEEAVTDKKNPFYKKTSSA